MIVNKKTSEYPSIFTIAIIVALGIIIYAGNALTINTSKITDVICLLAFTVMPTSAIACVICFLIPLTSGITVLYIYGYAVLMILIKSKNHKMGVYIPLIAIFLYEIIMMLIVDVTQINLIIGYSLVIFLLLYLMDSDEVNTKSACVAYVFGAVVLLLCVFTTAIQNSSLASVLSGSVRIGAYEGIDNIGGVALVSENANSLAYFALVAIFIAFSLLNKFKVVGKTLLIVSMIILAVIALFTVSRTFILCLIILFVLEFLVAFNFKNKMKVLVVVSIVLAIGIPYLQQKTQIFESFALRFEEDTVSTGGSRTDIFIEYMGFLRDNPLRLIFGTGATFYKEACGLSRSMHNGLQQILVAYGLLGFFPMIAMLVRPIVKFFKQNKFKMIRIMPLIAVVLFIQTIQFLNPCNLVLPYAVAILCMKIPDTESIK